MSLIDTHSHLAMLAHAPLDMILDRAKKFDISKMISVSVDEASWALNQAIAEKLPNVWFSLGIHPHDAKDWKDCRPRMEALYAKVQASAKCVAVGETGLDFFYNRSTREEQLTAFTDQVQLAKAWNLPIIIHCREAFDDVYQILRTEGLGEAGGVMHCFTGGPKEAKEAVEVGLTISFSGILTFKNATNIQEAAKILDLKSIVIETDCPFLAPVPHRGKPNEPAFLPDTAKFLAALRNQTADEIAQATSENANRLFRLS